MVQRVQARGRLRPGWSQDTTSNRTLPQTAAQLTEAEGAESGADRVAAARRGDRGSAAAVFVSRIDACTAAFSLRCLMFNRNESGANPDTSDPVYYGIRTAYKSPRGRLACGPLILTFVTGLILKASRILVFSTGTLNRAPVAVATRGGRD